MLPAVTTAAQPPDLAADLVERIRVATISSQSEGTRGAYESAWRRFEWWCRTNSHQSLPAQPATIVAYLVDAAETIDESAERAYSPQSLGKWIAAIGDRHCRAGVEPNPAAHESVRQTAAVIRRQYASRGDRPRTPRIPLLTDDVMPLVTAAREQGTGSVSEVYERRDSALLLMGFAAALRRSELTELTGANLELHAADGVHVHLRKSKTDQMGRVPCSRCHGRPRRRPILGVRCSGLSDAAGYSPPQRFPVRECSGDQAAGTRGWVRS